MESPFTTDSLFDKVPARGPLISGHVYQRKSLNERFGGNTQKGIVPSKKEPVILLFHTKEKIQQFYSDGFDPSEGVYWYSGEGTKGDMKWGKANCAVRDHERNSQDVYLFERAQRKDGLWRLYGLMKYLGYQEENRPDKSGHIRKAIVFALMPMLEHIGVAHVEINGVSPKKNDLAILRAKAIASSTIQKKRKSVQQVYERSEKIKKYALARAGGYCEMCLGKAPFLTCENVDYLEVHHINRLADEGLESIDSVGAICPNCHRRCHYGRDAEQCNLELKSVVDLLERKVKMGLPLR